MEQPGGISMRRRDLLKVGAAAVAALVAPRVLRGDSPQVLKFVPLTDLSVLDPVWARARVTHNHGYLVFDTLYGLDESYVPRPQMVEAHEVAEDGLRWVLTLRQGLCFHDGTPVLGRDVVASIRRWAVRDGFGQALLAATEELSAPSDRLVEFRLKRRFPHLPQALAGASTNMPCIMPERLAQTDPYTQVTEMVGSGPYRFRPGERVAGSRAAYERFAGYLPRDGTKPSFTAGPKIAHFDRIEWLTIADATTASAALESGEVDWWEMPIHDLVPTLLRDSGVIVEITETTGLMAVMRLNHLQPPFDNPAVRRALLGAIDQAEAMTAVAGTDRAWWRDGIGLFGQGMALVNDAGIEVLTAPRDYEKVKRELAAAGYRGERIIVLLPADIPGASALGQAGAEQLRRAGINVDLQVMDFASLLRRQASKGTIDNGGWNVFFTFFDGYVGFNPYGNASLQANGSGVGWPESPQIEALRAAWLDAEDLAAERRIAGELQLQLWHDVPYIPMGQLFQPTAHRSSLIDVPKGFPLFYGVRRV
jgi:peptide/nickel transport system substrate-binding protein